MSCTHNSSLSIGQGNGNILLYCFAGCTNNAIYDALENQGIRTTNNFKFKKVSALPEGIYQKIGDEYYVSHWTYRDKEGSTVGYVVRYENNISKKKSFRPYFKNIAGMWKAGYSTKDKRPLYNLDKISKASVEDEIWVVEGEKCADALMQLGVLATTSPGGSNGATKADWRPLASRRVLIWPDNDPAGQTYAANVFQILTDIGESTLKIEKIDIDKLKLKEKEDAYDWVKKGNTLPDLLNLPRSFITGLKEMDIIIVEPGQISKAMDEAEDLLIRKKPFEIFQRNGLVVRIFNPKLEKNKSKETSVKLLSVKTGYLTDLLNREMTFVRRSKGELIPVEPPEKIADRYLQRAGHWKLNHLQGLIFAPTLRQDGSVLEQPGYDIESGLYYVKNDDRIEPLVKNPDKQDAKAGLVHLRRILQDFNFVTPEDESVLFAAILTGLVRGIFLTAPAFGISASTAGSGKTLLANIVHIIVTGSPVTPMSLGFSKEEQEKQIFAKLIEGRPIVLIDNVEEPIKSGLFCEIMTSSSGKHSGRILGVSDTIDVSTIVTFLVTGNNLSFQGDMTRRVLRCTIDSKCEQPENRTDFRINNLTEYVMLNRPRLVMAGLTILKAYIEAGRPPQDIPRWGGFEEWSYLIRSALDRKSTRLN